ncbi:MAG: septum formation protein Maf [Planctomycetes bacterium]|nr:septum formation protein Maf [Planctomycetota bacterium]
MRLILASQSPDRLELLRTAGYDVLVMPADLAEPDPASFSDFDAGLMHIAIMKARAVRARGAEGLILAADTVGVVAGEIFGKPRDRADARRMLSAMSNTVHEVCTGWCLMRTRDQLHWTGCEHTSIAMRAWTDDELQWYLDGGEWQGKSGAYGLQLPHDPFVTRIDGSLSNVIGIPLERLATVLREIEQAGGVPG